MVAINEDEAKTEEDEFLSGLFSMVDQAGADSDLILSMINLKFQLLKKSSLAISTYAVGMDTVGTILIAMTNMLEGEVDTEKLKEAMADMQKVLDTTYHSTCDLYGVNPEKEEN
jgi:hypothetical protein